MRQVILFFCKHLSLFSKKMNIGGGGTWPGEIALRFDPNILSYFLSSVNNRIILICGTNGKTTTAKMIFQILREIHPDAQIVHNDSGANLLNGVASAFIQKNQTHTQAGTSWAVLEVDENTFPQLMRILHKGKIDDKKIIIVMLNLFRDQLDRYGEVDTIARNWKQALDILPNATLVANADDPQVAYLGKNRSNTVYFGLDKPDKYLQKLEHATDSTYCPNCSTKLEYKGVYFSHLGNWFCKKCGYKRPSITVSQVSTSLSGLYNEYNALAALLVSMTIGVDLEVSKKILGTITPAFGRQEEVAYKGRVVKLFLSKNPAGFNASLRTVSELNATHTMLILNDRIPDGTDVSWIWDVDFESIPKENNLYVSGDRAYDMALRIKYAREVGSVFTSANFQDVLHEAIKSVEKNKTLYVLATYSAMLEIRQVLHGKKIL